MTIYSKYDHLQPTLVLMKQHISNVIIIHKKLDYKSLNDSN